MSDPLLPRRYRTLLAAHPRAWRERQGDVVLGTLLDVHAASGRRRPTLAERWSFLLDGLRLHLRPTRVRPTPAAWSVPLDSIRLFDQTNGATAERPVSDLEQRRANREEYRNSTERRVVNTAWIGFDMLPH